MLFCLIQTDLIDKFTMEEENDRNDTDDELPDLADLMKSLQDPKSIFNNKESNVGSSSRYNIY